MLTAPRMRLPAVRRPALPRPAAPSLRALGWPAVVLGLTVVAAVVRGSNALGAPLWIDEGISIGIAKHSLTAIPGLLRQDGSPPVYYLLLHWWIGLFGSSPSSTHAMSVVAAVLAVPAAAWAAWRPFGARAGVLAAALVAFVPFVGEYADETRMYTLAFLFAALATGAFLRAFIVRSRPWALGFGALTALLCLTHGWGLFYAAGAALAFVMVFVVGPDRRGLAIDGLLAAGVAIVLFAPWVPTFLFQSHHTGAPWSHMPDVHSLKRAGERMLAGRTAETVLLVVAGGGMLAAIRSAPRLALGLACVAAIALVSLFAGYLVSRLNQPVWALRYLAVPLAPLLIAIGAGLDRVGIAGVVALVVVVALSWVGKPTAASLSHKSDVRELAATIRPELPPGSVVASPQPEQVPVLNYYFRERLWYVTPLGMQRDVGVVNWIDALHRLRSSSIETTLAAAVRALPPGGRILLAAPRFGKATAPWTRSIQRREKRWRRWLERRPGLVQIDVYNPNRYGSRATLAGVLFERVPSARTFKAKNRAALRMLPRRDRVRALRILRRLS